MYAYNFPRAGLHLPQTQRRVGGLATWKSGIDGSMTWAYAHIRKGAGMVDQVMGEAYVLRTEDSVLDTLHWEGLREGVDDIRYLSTLLDTLNRAAGPYGTHPLVAETWSWLGALDVAKVDLVATRHEMATRIIKLRELGK